MRRLSILLLAACAGLGAYEHRIHNKLGAAYVKRGYSSWVMIQHWWSQNETSFTADPVTETITAPGHTFTNGNLVWLTSSGTLPGGLTSKRQYYVCDISGDTFRFGQYGDVACSTNPAWMVDITSAGTGTHRAGRVMDNGPPGTNHVYLETPSGVPSGVSYEVWCENALCPSVTTPVIGWRSYNGGAFFMFRFTASQAAALGAATITATLYATGEAPESIQFSLTVEDLVPIPSARPASYSTIPTLSTWDTTILTLARRWCDPTSYATAAAKIGTMSYGVDSAVWFYDGAWTYRQIARYTGNPNWNNCADYINDWYRNYTFQINGGHAGYKAFTAGLKSSCASCDMRNRRAIELMVGAQAMAATSGWPWDYDIRETAYYLETLMSYELTGGARRYYSGTSLSKLQRAAENLLAMFDELFREGTWTYQQTYFDGLALRALIQYFEMTGDQQVPVAIKTALDWLWANAWNDTTKKLVYNPEPWGPRCAYGCADQDGWEWTELIGLIVPAMGWYYWYSGDDTYRQHGDEWFKALPRWPHFTGTASNDYVTIPDHGLSVDDRVNVQTRQDGSKLPGGLVGNGNYYVKSVVDANTITVCSTKGGATINLTSDGVGSMGLKCISSTCRGWYSGKMFSQQFRWSIAYVQWRQGQTPYVP